MKKLSARVRRAWVALFDDGEEERAKEAARIAAEAKQATLLEQVRWCAEMSHQLARDERERRLHTPIL